MNRWFVYRHTSPSGKAYIDITVNIKSRWASNGRHYCTYNSIFKKAIDKYGWDNITHEVLLENISKTEAVYAEKYLIRWYKIHGISYNITDGGDGTLGVKPSEDTKKKISESSKGKHLDNTAAIKASKEAVAKMSPEQRKEAFATYGMKGKRHSEDAKLKMSLSAKGRDVSKAVSASVNKRREQATPIIVTKDGKFINEYQLLIDACRDLSLNPANAYRALTKGIQVNKFCLTYKI